MMPNVVQCVAAAQVVRRHANGAGVAQPVIVPGNTKQNTRQRAPGVDRY